MTQAKNLPYLVLYLIEIKSIFNKNVKGKIPSPMDFLNLEVVMIKMQMGSDIHTKVMYPRVQEPTDVHPRNIHPFIT